LECGGLLKINKVQQAYVQGMAGVYI